MQDTVAEVVADKVKDLIFQLEAMGLRRPSILRGLQMGVDRASKPAKRQASRS